VLVLTLSIGLLLTAAAYLAQPSLVAPLDAFAAHGEASPSPSAAAGPTETSVTTPSATPSAMPSVTPGATPSVAARTTSASPTPDLVALVGDRQRELERLAAKARAFTDQRTNQPTNQRTKRPVASFAIAEFNVQGASHRGNVEQRTRNARDLLIRYDVGVAAFQEFAHSQRVAFDRLAGGTYTAFPGHLGRSLDAENSIVWRTDTFDLVKGETRPYPYFKGAIRNMPRVLLRHKQTGVEFWVTSYHNPATCCGYGNAAGYRARAVSEQARDANTLVALTKAPLIVAGDMNDRSTYFCAMASRAPMHSADGSTYDGGCRMAGHAWIDWILGTKDVAFSGYQRDRSGFVRATSDHPIVVAQVKVTGKPGDGANTEGAIP
jgi:hypothetical protein